MLSSYRKRPLFFALSIITIVVTIIVVVVASHSRPLLANNSTSSVNARLFIDGDLNGSYSSSEPGFSFSGLVPGGSVTTPESFKLRNNGNVALDVSLSIPNSPSVSGSGSVDLDKVFVVVDCVTSTANFSINESIQALVASHAGGGITMLPDAMPISDANCTISATMDIDAITGESAFINNFNLVFDGVSV